MTDQCIFLQRMEETALNKLFSWLFLVMMLTFRPRDIQFSEVIRGYVDLLVQAVMGEQSIYGFVCKC